MLSLATKNVFNRALDAGETVIGGPSLMYLIAASLDESEAPAVVIFQLGDGKFIEGVRPTLEIRHTSEVYVSIRNAGDDRRYVLHYDAAKQSGAILETL